MKNHKKNLNLIGFRGGLIFLIVFHHYTCRYNELFPDRPYVFTIHSAHGGQIGNVFFLFLAGFFVARYVTDNVNSGIIGKFKFFINKYWRLWPAYFISVTTIFIVSILFPLQGRTVSLATYIIDSFFIVHPGTDNIDSAHWFMSTLLLLHFVITLVLLINNADYRKNLVLLIAILIMLLLVYKTVNHVTFLFFDSFTSLYTLSYFNGLIFFFFRRTNNQYYFLSFIVISLLTCYMFKIFILCLLYVVLLVLLNADNKIIRLIFSNKIMIFLGNISFSWYLVHQNIGFTILYYCYPISNGNQFFLIIPLVITITIATALYHIARLIPTRLFSNC